MNLNRIDMLPEHCQSGVRSYILNGRPMGDFLTAVFSNNLMDAFGRADEINLRCMDAYVRFLYNHAPSDCYGLREKVKAWIARGGLSTTKESP